MATKTIRGRVQHPLHTTAEWESNTDVVLYDGEIGLEGKTDGTIYARVGNGTDVWMSLPYLGGVGGGGGSGGGYTLPAASAETLGGVKIGDGLSIDEAGVLSLSGTDTAVQFATTEQITAMLDGLLETGN